MSSLKIFISTLLYICCIALGFNTRLVSCSNDRHSSASSSSRFRRNSNRRHGRVVISAGMLSTIIESSVAGGALSGSLHAITGPDHVAAVLPASVGGTWFDGLRVGAVWGLGHGISATILGLGAMFLKGQFSSRFRVLEKVSALAESAVGFSLIFIGLTGIKEGLEAYEDSKNSKNKNNNGDGDEAPLGLKAILTNGALHGCSLDGAPSIAPVLAMKSMTTAIWYLLSYMIGTTFAMSMTAAAIAESSNRLVATSNFEPQKLCLLSSGVALLVGIFWVVKSLFLG